MDPAGTLLDLLLPAGAAALILGAGAAARRPATSAVAIAAAGMLAIGRLAGWPPLPAREALGWTFWLLPLFAGAGLLLGARPRPIALAGWFALALGAARLLLAAPIAYRWSSGQSRQVMVVVAALGALLLEGLARPEARPGARRAGLWVVSALASGLALGATGSFKLGALAIALGLALIPLALAAGRSPHGDRGAGAPVGLALGALLLAGQQFSALPFFAAILLLGGLRASTPAPRGGRLALALAFTGAGLGLALAAGLSGGPSGF